MKKTLAVFVVSLLPLLGSQRGMQAIATQNVAAGEPTFTEIQSVKGANVTSGTTATVTLTTPTATNAVFCAIIYYPQSLTITSVKDNAGTPNTYTVSAHSPAQPNSGAPSTALAYLLNVPASPGATVTLTMSGTITYNTSIRCTEFHRPSGTWTIDNDFASTSTTAGTTANSPTVTASVAGELLFANCVAASAQDCTAAGLWTQDTTTDATSGTAGEYILAGASGGTAINFTLSASEVWNAMGIAVK